MKSYRTLAWKEILEQKVVSLLNLTEIILSKIMKKAVGHTAGVL